MTSKIELTDRLRNEGRWDEASRFRDEQRQRLRKAGWKRHDANEESWILMEAEFQPQPQDGGFYFLGLTVLPPPIPCECLPSILQVWPTLCYLLLSAEEESPGTFQAIRQASERRCTLQPGREDQPFSDGGRELLKAIGRLNVAVIIEDSIRHALAVLDRTQQDGAGSSSAVDSAIRDDEAAVNAAVRDELKEIVDSLPKIAAVLKVQSNSVEEKYATSVGQQNERPRGA